jgi:glycosyltransferase involved in cell wall biosynthesis
VAPVTLVVLFGLGCYRADPSMTTVLYVSLYTTIGGAERALLELLGAMDSARFRPLVVVPDDGELARRLAARGFEVRRETFPTPPLHRLWHPPVAMALVRAAWRLRRLARARDIRLFHCGDLLAALLLLPASWPKGRVLFQVNYLGGTLRRWLLNLLGLLTLHVVVAYSRDQQAQIARAPGWLRRRTVVVWPGIDAAPFERGDGLAVRRELGVDEGTPLVGLLARYDAWKGHAVFLDAAALVRARRPDVRFVIAGGALNAESLPHVARCRDAVMKRRHALGLEASVLVLEHRDDVPSVLAALDVVACPSYREPFGMIVVEALAARRAVVASDSGGPAEIIEHGRSGLLFATGSSHELALRLLELVEDGRRRREMGEAGRARVREAFTAGRYAAEMEALYAAMA